MILRATFATTIAAIAMAQAQAQAQAPATGLDATRWRFRRAVTVTASPARLTLDSAVYNHTQTSQADLRLASSADGRERPYILDTAAATTATATVPARIVNRETSGGALAVTLEFDGKQLHNRLLIDTVRDEFRAQVRVEASDDGRAWATARASAYIFRYRTGDGQTAEHLAVTYPDSRRRLVRLTITPWPDAAQFTGVSVTRSTASQARRSTLFTATQPAFQPQGATTASSKTTCATFDTASLAPRDQLILEPASPAIFHRAVTVEASAGGKQWQWLTAGAVYRTGPQPADASLTVDLPETRLPHLRLCIQQGDDQPLQLAKLHVAGIDRDLLFPATPGQYWLYYGNKDAAAPSYDLARTAPAGFAESATAATLGQPESNPAYQAPPEPTPAWTDRYPALLYTALALAVAGLGWMALRLLRQG